MRHRIAVHCRCLVTRLAAVLLLAVTASCGGGSGSGGGPAPVPAPSGLSYPSPQTYTAGTAITPLTPSVTGAVTSYSVAPPLPPGLSIDTTSGRVSGTPTAAAAGASYTVTAMNGTGSTTFGLSITVNPAGPSVTGNGFAPVTGPGDTDGYAPFASGNQWLFDATTTDPAAAAPAWTTMTTLGGTQTVQGVSAMVLHQSNPSGTNSALDSYYYPSGGGITYLGNSDATDPITAALVPYVQLLFPVQLGTQSTLTAMRLPAGTDGGGHPLTVDLTQQIVNAAFESVSEPAGTFPNALRQATTVSGTVYDAALNQSTSVAVTGTTWLVPGVGIVKETTSTTTGAQTTKGTLDLRGYMVNGVRHGLGLPFTVIGDLSPLNGDPNPAVGNPAVATDGTNFLVVSKRATGSSPFYTVQWLATLIAPDGTVIKTVELTTPSVQAAPGDSTDAVVAFDGTNYLVVYEQDDTTSVAGQPEWGLAVLVSTSGTVLGAATTITPLGCGVAGCAPPALAFDGTRYLLVYPQSMSGLWQIKAQFISPADGQPDGPPFAVTPAPGYPQQLAVAFGGGVYLVAWQQASWTGQQPGLYVGRIQPDGTLLDPAGTTVVASSTCCGDPALASDGNDFLLAFADNRPDGQHTTVSAVRVAAATGAVDPATIAVASSQTDVTGLLQAAFIAGNYWIAWQGSTAAFPSLGLWGQRLSPTGSVLFADTFGMRLAPAGSGRTVALQGGPQGGLLAWRDQYAPLAPNDVGGLMIYPPGP